MAWPEIFEEGRAAAERAGDLPILAMTHAVYGAVCGNNQAMPLEHVRYSKEAVRIADQTGDAALRVGTRGSLIYGYMYSGQLAELERVTDEIIALAAGDPHLGTNVIGFSPLMGALGVRPLAVGSLRDPATALRESSLARQAALDCGYTEQALWAVAWEIELRSALGISDGARALAQTASQLSENMGAVNEVVASTSQCEALIGEGEWEAVSTMTKELLRGIRESGAGANWVSRLLSILARAQLELGDPRASRAAALEGVVFMRDTKSVWNPHNYAVLARAQLELAEPAADISNTLGEYEALLTQTGFHIYEGELHELRACLAEREGQHTERTAALARAHDRYTRFGMVAQAARIEDLRTPGSNA